MLANMTKCYMNVFHIEHLIPVTPIFAYYILGVSRLTEIYLTRFCTIFAILEFAYIMACVSKQYCDAYDINFFFV